MKEKISVDIDTTEALRNLRGLSEKDMLVPWKRAMRKTGRWIIGETTREVSKAKVIPNKVIRPRLKFYWKEGDVGKVWFGLNEIMPHKIKAAVLYGGRSYPTSIGVQTGKYKYPGAWVIWPGRGKFLRKEEGGKEMPAGPVFRRVPGAKRKPIEKVYIDLEKEGRIAFKNTISRTKDKMLTLLKQEVNYAIHQVLTANE